MSRRPYVWGVFDAGSAAWLTFRSEFATGWSQDRDNAVTFTTKDEARWNAERTGGEPRRFVKGGA
jgi:hypothetical protein